MEMKCTTGLLEAKVQGSSRSIILIIHDYESPYGHIPPRDRTWDANPVPRPLPIGSESNALVIELPGSFVDNSPRWGSKYLTGKAVLFYFGWGQLSDY